MKRPPVLKFVVAWCIIYGSIMLLSSYALIQRYGLTGALSALASLVAAVILLESAFRIYRLRKVAAWICAVILGLLTLRLPFGYFELLARKGRHTPGIILFFSIFSCLNAFTIAFLLGPKYR